MELQHIKTGRVTGTASQVHVSLDRKEVHQTQIQMTLTHYLSTLSIPSISGSLPKSLHLTYRISKTKRHIFFLQNTI
jgi:hypothetical protein